MLGSKKRIVHVLVAFVALAVLAGCQPERPSAGRGTPVRRVLLIGDSITHGLYGTTPKVHPLLQQRMAARGISVLIGGFPGENPTWVWPGNPRWSEIMRYNIQTADPDMVIIQSTLFPNAGDPALQARYLSAVRELVQIAQSRGAHTYFVKHPTPSRPRERLELIVIERLQAQAGARRGISWIPLDVWINGCDRPVVGDGWHLSGNGQRCHADAITAAVDQLRTANRR